MLQKNSIGIDRHNQRVENDAQKTRVSPASLDKGIITMDSGILTNVLSGVATPSIFCGILFIVISLPLLRGSIPMNRFYGFRIPKAFASDANWYAINEYGAKVLILWSMVMIASGVLLPFLNLPSPLVGLIPLVLCSAAAIGQTLFFARQLKTSDDKKPVEPVNQGDGE